MLFFRSYLESFWGVLLELSPWLLLGLFLAGVMHLLMGEDFIRRHLGGRRFMNVLKAVSLGVPLPLCSCGVIPAALGLKRDGASNGAAMGFLISTPQTGVDSILVSGGFLGWPFAFFKVVSALVSGMVGGLLMNMVEANGEKNEAGSAVGESGGCCHAETVELQGCCCEGGSGGSGRGGIFGGRRLNWRELFGYGYGQLFRDIYVWLVVGLAVAALITTLVPADYFARQAWAQGVLGMLAVLAVSIPMYVCSTSSVPLAAALVSIGMPGGAALVFLMAGPTTNVATIGMVGKTFGWRGLLIYLGTVIGMSLGSGLVFNRLVVGASGGMGHVMWMPGWVAVLGALIVLGLIFWYLVGDVRKWLGKRI